MNLGGTDMDYRKEIVKRAFDLVDEIGGLGREGFSVCPECGSRDVDESDEKDGKECLECNYVWGQRVMAYRKEVVKKANDKMREAYRNQVREQVMEMSKRYDIEGIDRLLRDALRDGTITQEESEQLKSESADPKQDRNRDLMREHSMGGSLD